MAKEYKLDVFAGLTACDRRDGSWLSNQSEDAIKEFTPTTFIRYLSNVRSPHAANVILAVNEFLNNNMYLIEKEKHPDLIFRLAALCGTGKQQKHEWIPLAKKPIITNKVRDLLFEYNPLASDSEIDLLLSLHTRETFLQFVNDAGLSDSEVKEIMKEYDKLNKETGSEEVIVRKTKK